MVATFRAIKKTNNMNKKIFKGILQIAIYLFLFITIQVITQVLISFVSLVAQGYGAGEAMERMGKGLLPTDGKTLCANMAVASLFTALLFIRRGWALVSRSYLQSRPWSVMIWTLILSLGTLIPCSFLEELTHVEMPAATLQAFTAMLREPISYPILAVLVPLTEELVFRGAILRTLLTLTHNRYHWVAIAISAILFAIAHGNMAQMLHVVPVGLLLGWLYYRTNSIVPSLILHCVNNSAVYIITNLITADPNARLIDIFGTTQHVWMAVGFSLCLFVPALFQLATRLKKA